MRAIPVSLVLWAGLWAGSAGAETVRVQSGEHEGFSRLVLSFAGPADWQLRRSADGYDLAVARDGLRYDVSDVFRLIPKTRLTAIWADPASGDLRLLIDCACHALPFELGPGVLVIDLRDGPAPPGSSFERDGDGVLAAALTQRAQARPRARPGIAAQITAPATTVPDPATATAPAEAGYDWLSLAGPLAPASLPVEPQPETAVDITAPPNLSATAATIRHELARAASRGAIELALPQTDAIPHEESDFPGSGSGTNVAVATPAFPLPGLGIGTGTDRKPGLLTAEGGACLPDAAVDLAGWGDARPPARALGPRTAGLFGEFDRVNAEAAGDAVRYLLSLGFGAEARAMIAGLSLQDPEVAVWHSIARIMDGETDPAGAFAGMQVCDAPAAMWAVLAEPTPDQAAAVQTAAILRAFSALPVHLRRHLGPTLADRLLARGDTDAVRALRDAILRAPGEAGPGVALMETRLQAAQGAATDTGTLSALRATSGAEGVQATLALIRAALTSGEAVPAPLITEAEARLMEYRGAEEEVLLQSVLAEAHASQGDFARGFELAGGQDAPDAARIWAILARHGADGAVLERAVLAGPAEVPPLPDDTRRALARRLLDLGFAGPARLWAADTTTPAADADRLLLAEAALAGQDARAALRHLAGLAGASADALRLAAMSALGAPGTLSLVAAEGDDTVTAQTARRLRDWATVAERDSSPWREAARLATTAPPETSSSALGTPLAQGKALVADSAATRASLLALLAATSPRTAP